MNALDTPCVHCGYTAKRLILLAMLEDAGAQVGPQRGTPECSAREDGGEHEFKPREAK